VAALKDVIPLFNMLEHNPKQVRSANKNVHDLALAYCRGMLANSDTHVADLGATYTLAAGDTPSEFLRHCALGQCYLVSDDLSPSSIQRLAFKWLGQLVSPHMPRQEQYALESGIGPLDLLASRIERGGSLGHAARAAVYLALHSGVPHVYVAGREKNARYLQNALGVA
jgi:hypothetical protein